MPEKSINRFFGVLVFITNNDFNLSFLHSKDTSTQIHPYLNIKNFIFFLKRL